MLLSKVSYYCLHVIAVIACDVTACDLKRNMLRNIPRTGLVYSEYELQFLFRMQQKLFISTCKQGSTPESFFFLSREVGERKRKNALGLRLAEIVHFHFDFFLAAGELKYRCVLHRRTGTFGLGGGGEGGGGDLLARKKFTMPEKFSRLMKQLLFQE